MVLNEALPEEHRQAFASLEGEDGAPRYCCRSDRDDDGRFVDGWVAVNDRRVVAFGPLRPPLHLPLDRITGVRIDELFGASRLVAVTDEGEHCLARYSRNLVGEFAALARVIDQLREGREAVLPDDLEHSVCPRCGSPLPERGATCPRCLSRRGIILRLLSFVRPYRAQAAVLVGVTAVGVGAAMVPPYMFKLIADRVIAAGRHGELGLWAGVMAAAFLVESAFRFLGNWINTWLGARIVADLRSRLHERAQQLRMSYHSRRESGELVGRIMHDTGELQQFLTEGLPYFLVNSIAFVSIAVILMMMSWKLALLVFVPVPILLVGGKIFWTVLRPMFHKHGNRIGVLHSMLGESIGGVRTVKSLVQEQRRAGEFDTVNERLFRVDTTLARTFSGFFSSMGIFMAAGTVLVWYFGGRAVIESAARDGVGGVQLGTLLAFVGYMALFYGPLQWFAAVFSWMTYSMTAAERIFAVLDQPAEVDAAPDAIALPRVRGAIRFEQVRFSYERGKEVLKGIDLTIEPGTMAGLVGRSGAGKSTMINLICRFFDPDSGRITVDGHDLRAVDVHSWRRQVGIVMQEPFLFHASILENIRYGSPGASFEDVVRAARAAHAHAFICLKEEGYDTVIGEGGTGLSGGERQRVAIARAILHDPPVLILDEATSAVDSETEQHIQEAIANLIRGRTTIAIAHRLATLRNADRIVVLDEGAIVEQGTHVELMSRPDGHFSKLVRLQKQINRLRAKQVAWKE